jgi:maleylacetoacetate isomerase
VERVSGQGLVPVLVDGEQVVVDSMAIVRHLEDRQPDPPLYPAQPARRAEMEVFIDWFNRVWKRPPNRIEEELGRDDPDEELIAAMANEMAAALDLFEQLLDGRDYLLGDFSAADCAAFPFLKYAAARAPEDDELFHRILDRHQSVGGRPRLEAWIRRVHERPRS